LIILHLINIDYFHLSYDRTISLISGGRPSRSSPVVEVAQSRGHVVEERQNLRLGEAATVLHPVQSTPQVSS
jgi:hypothetical protein